MRRVLASGLVLLSGCAITAHLPVNRFQSSEAKGNRGRIDVNAGLQGSNRLTVVDDPTATPVDVDHPRFDRSNQSWTAGGDVGLTDRLDASLQFRNDYPPMIELKYQLEGQPESRAKPGNLSLSVAGGFGYSSQNETDTFGGLSAESKITWNGFDLATIAGYRTSRQVLVYGGAFYSLLSFSGSILQNRLTQAALSGNATERGFDLGIQFSAPRAWVRVEGSAASAHCTGSDIGLQSYFGVLLGFNIDDLP